MTAAPRYFGDFAVGQRFVLGSVEVTEEAIVRFAREFDPQPFHVDREKAAASMFQGLVASGWHTASLAMRLLVDGFARDVQALGSPGVDAIRWLVPVRPGDTLRLEVTVKEVRPSRSKNDRGTVQLEEILYNQRNEVAMTKLSLAIIARRPST